GDQSKRLTGADGQRRFPADIIKHFDAGAFFANAFAHEQDDTVQNQKRRRQHRRGEKRAQLVFKGKADHYRWQRGKATKAKNAASALHRGPLPLAKNSRSKTEPVPPKINQQRRRRTQMQHNEEWQKSLPVAHVPTKQGWQNDGMAEAADRKQFRGALQNSD